MAYSHRNDAQHNVTDLSQLGYKCTAMNGNCRLCEKMLVIDKSVNNNAVAHLKELLSRQQQLRTEINITHSPIIRDLPPEILSKVFYSCFSDEMASEHGEPAKGDVGVPFKLGAVCRTWRQVAWSSPELWTVIVFNKHSSTAFNACNQHLMIKERIERSGSLPLYISLYEHAEEDDDDDYDYDDDEEGKGKGEECECWKISLKLLTQCSHRWKDVKMDLLRESFKYIASNFKFTPPIRKLTLRSADSYQGWSDYPTNESERLKLWQEPYEFGPRHVQVNQPISFRHFSINWLHVRHVEAKRWPIEDCFNLLKSAPQLVSCSFKRIWMGRSESQSTPLVCHQSLQSLSVAYDNVSTSLFDNITLPSLEFLDYSEPGSRDALDGSYLISFFNRSCSPLKKLLILAQDVMPEHLMSILSTVPTLIHLCLRFPTHYGGRRSMTFLLQRFAKPRSTCETDGSNAESFLPQLEILENRGPGAFLLPYHWTLVPNAFERSSKLGSGGRRPLNALVFDTGRPHSAEVLQDKDTVDRLRTLQKAGIIISYYVLSDGRDIPTYCAPFARSHLVPVSWK
ncbi:hypothetical protein CPC08DRAFT_717132 [Agrocybe pediades]|nr:hypothetical protein CPC08DRAFT_717132 [Agrocybe pediades]